MHISIQEAINLTGKSQATIYRLIKRPDSEPYIKREGDSYTIDKEYLLKVYPFSHENHSENHENQNDKSENHREKDERTAEVNINYNEQYYLNLVAAKDTTIQMISEQLQAKELQLQVKDQQLSTKDQQLSQLIERTREQNIIIQSLQEKTIRQLAPPQGTEASIQSNQKKEEVKTPLVDKLLIGVAVVVFVALLLFFALMLIAYLNR